MAEKPRDPARVLSASPLWRGAARRLTPQDRRRALALIKAEPQAVKALARSDAAAILAAVKDVAARRRQHSSSRRPAPWTQAQALAALHAHADGASLFGAVRLLQAAAHKARPLGYARNPDEEAVRIDQGLLLGFAGREVAGAAPNPGASPGVASPRFGAFTARPVLTQHAVGLLGPNGPMPYVWTHQVRRLPNTGKHKAQASFLAFLNLLQRRQLGLFYRAWSDAIPVTAYDCDAAEVHPIEQRLSALAGLGHAGLHMQDSLPPAFKHAVASTLSRRVKCPSALEAMVARYLGAPAQVLEFAGAWAPIPPDQQTRLGQVFTRLGQLRTPRLERDGESRQVDRVVAGQEAVAGARVWDAASRFDLVVGPLDMSTYLRLLPGGDLWRELRDLVSLYLGPEWQWRVVPKLAAPEVPQARLGRGAARLGLTQWLGTRRSIEPAEDLRLPVCPQMRASSEGGMTSALPNDALDERARPEAPHFGHTTAAEHP